MTYVLSFEEHGEASESVPVPLSFEGWSVWRVHVGDLGGRDAFVEEELVDLRAALVALDEEGNEHGRLPVDFRKRMRSGPAAVLEGSDRAGVLRVTARVAMGDAHLHLDVTLAHEGRTPKESLPALRFLSGLLPGRRLGLWLHEVGDWAAPPVPWPHPPAVEEPYIGAIELLDQLQRATGTSFPIPSELSSADLKEIRHAITLLSGGVLTSTWTEGTVHVAREALDALGEAHADRVGRMEETGEYHATVGGHDLYVGVISQRVLEFVVADVEADAGDRGQVRLRVVPGGDNRIERRLVTRAFFDPFDRDVERVVMSADDMARVLRGTSLRDRLRSA